MQKITMVGTGYVGLVSGVCFAEMGNYVVCCDVDAAKVNQLKQGQLPMYEPGLAELVKGNMDEGRLTFTTDIAEAICSSEIICIAVGTPMSETGEADLKYVKAAAKKIGENLNSYKIIVNKSTVPVGTGRLVESIIQDHLKNSDIHFDVVSNPEFLREGSAVQDCMHMERVIIGANSERAAAIITELHEPFHSNIFVTGLENAEMIKYASNCFLATKISYINAIAVICERVGADVTKVAEGMGMDSRIGSKFLQAGIGYGGSCFPKDTHALVHMAESKGYDFQLMKSVISINEQQKISVVHKLENTLGDLQGNTITILGLSYKPNTNDMRDAPSLQIIPKLLQRGAKVKAYDPVATEKARHHFGDKIEYFNNLYEALIHSDACVILTEWEEIVNMDLDLVYTLLRLPVIVDGRNCFSLEDMRKRKFIYQSIGRPIVKGEDEGDLSTEQKQSFHTRSRSRSKITAFNGSYA